MGKFRHTRVYSRPLQRDVEDYELRGDTGGPAGRSWRRQTHACGLRPPPTRRRPGAVTPGARHGESVGPNQRQDGGAKHEVAERIAEPGAGGSMRRKMTRERLGLLRRGLVKRGALGGSGLDCPTRRRGAGGAAHARKVSSGGTGGPGDPQIECQQTAIERTRAAGGAGVLRLPGHGEETGRAERRRRGGKLETLSDWSYWLASLRRGASRRGGLGTG